MKKNIYLALCAAILLTGCSTGQLLTSTEPKQTIYTLRPLEVSPDPAASDARARVVEFSISSLPPGMDTDRIALFVSGGQKIDYYAGARWSAPLGEIMENFTRRTSSSVLPYVVGVTAQQGIVPDYKLQIKVNELQPVYEQASDSPPLLTVNLEFTLIALPGETIVSSFTLSKKEIAAENRLDVITLGLERILQDVQKEAFFKLDKTMRAEKTGRNR